MLLLRRKGILAAIFLLTALLLDLSVCTWFSTRVDAGIAPLVLVPASVTAVTATARVAVVIFHSKADGGQALSIDT